ncbi:MAG: cytochrome c biogenesis protein CcdA [Candidatus Woesearchaeota archaeon]|nr:cytochrome c biogenesis protein CcdA [Candidatus Woesearchaeota archaeon]
MEELKPDQKKGKRPIYFFILLGIFLSFVVLSWFGYFGYLRYAAANVTKISQLPPLVFYGFAFFAGIVSFFAPCAIGILPAYLSYYLNIEEVGNKKAVYYGSFAALGLVSFYLVLGILTIIFGQIIGMTLMAYNREISAAILVIVGLALLFNISINVKKYLPFLRTKGLSEGSLKSKSHERGVFLFGIFYGVEAFMCALLLMIPLIIYPLLGGDLLTSIISFIIFAFALGLCMVAATILISKSRKILKGKFMASTLMLKRVAGIVMLLSAFYMIYLIIALPGTDMSGMSMEMDGVDGTMDGMEMDGVEGDVPMDHESNDDGMIEEGGGG